MSTTDRKPFDRVIREFRLHRGGLTLIGNVTFIDSYQGQHTLHAAPSLLRVGLVPGRPYGSTVTVDDMVSYRFSYFDPGDDQWHRIGPWLHNGAEYLVEFRELYENGRPAGEQP